MKYTKLTLALLSLALLAASGPLRDRSGTITAGGTAQELAPASTGRKYILIQNISAGDLWINFGKAAAVDTPGSFVIGARGTACYESAFIVNQPISIIGATTGQKFTVKEG